MKVSELTSVPALLKPNDQRDDAHIIEKWNPNPFKRGVSKNQKSRKNQD